MKTSLFLVPVLCAAWSVAYGQPGNPASACGENMHLLMLENVLVMNRGCEQVSPETAAHRAVALAALKKALPGCYAAVERSADFRERAKQLTARSLADDQGRQVMREECERTFSDLSRFGSYVKTTSGLDLAIAPGKR